MNLYLWFNFEEVSVFITIILNFFSSQLKPLIIIIKTFLDDLIILVENFSQALNARRPLNIRLGGGGGGRSHCYVYSEISGHLLGSVVDPGC